MFSPPILADKIMNFSILMCKTAPCLEPGKEKEEEICKLRFHTSLQMNFHQPWISSE